MRWSRRTEEEVERAIHERALRAANGDPDPTPPYWTFVLFMIGLTMLALVIIEATPGGK